MRLLWLTGLAFASSLGAQNVPPGSGFALTPDAKIQLDSMARHTISAHAEQSACVTTSVMRDTIFVIVAIKPAVNVVRTDSIQVITNGKPLCAWWQPGIHSHVLNNGWLEYPSPVDYHSVAASGTFGFLLSVKADGTWKLRAYP